MTTNLVETPLVAPLDEHNRRLLEHVHPADWVDPEPAGRYHLVVVGAGTAGLVSAAIAASLGARVALVERHLLGGDCLNVGCVPSKAVISAARAWHAARRAAGDFGGPAATGDGDFAAAMERMRRLRAAIAPVDGAPRFRELGVDVFLGDGRFIAADAVEVGSHRLRFRRAVVATGARATGLPVPGLAEAGYLTNETVFSLTARPSRLAVVGGGPIGCELAQAFTRLGSEVHLFDVAPHVLPREDADAAAIVERALERDGIRLHLPVELREVRREGGAKVVAFEDAGGRAEVECSEILLAVGRAPNVEGLGLEAAGVAYGKAGVEVDDRMQTTNRRVFACGDVASPFKFTHAADAQARIVVQNALFGGRGKASRLHVPWCTYTDPEVAHVGYYAEEAERAGLAVDTVTVPFHDVDRARLDGEEEGFLRVHLKRGTDTILGGTLVAARAGDMIGPLVLAVTHGLGLGRFSSTIFPYPTQGEVYRKAGDAWRRTKLTPFVRRLFTTWFRLTA